MRGSQCSGRQEQLGARGRHCLKPQCSGRQFIRPLPRLRNCLRPVSNHNPCSEQAEAELSTAHDSPSKALQHLGVPREHTWRCRPGHTHAPMEDTTLHVETRDCWSELRDDALAIELVDAAIRAAFGALGLPSYAMPVNDEVQECTRSRSPTLRARREWSLHSTLMALNPRNIFRELAYGMFVAMSRTRRRPRPRWRRRTRRACR